MTLFQILSLAGVALAFLGVLRARSRSRVSKGVTIVWLLVWGVAATLILRPQWSAALARLLGIGRGADLVFYTAILAALIVFMAVFARMRRLESQLTQVVRELAVRDASAPVLEPLEATNDEREG